MLYEFITQGCCTFAARPHRSFVAFRPFGEVSSVIRGLVLDKELGQLQAAVLQALSVLRPDSRQAPIPQLRGPGQTRTWTRTWTRNLDKFYHVFSSCRATCPSSPGELGQGTWTTAGCRVTSSLSITPRFQAGPDSTTSWPRAETRTWTRTWTRNLDKFYHVFSSCRATCPSSPGELGQPQAALLKAIAILRQKWIRFVQ